MKPGRELDALVAEKVFGHKVVKETWGEEKQYSAYSIGKPRWDWVRNEGSILINPVPNYSEDVKDSWEIVQHLFMDSWLMELTGSEFLGDGFGGYDVYFICKAEVRGKKYGASVSVPHAICLAALKAVGVVL